MEAADPMPARLRAAAADVALMTAEDGLPGWTVIAGNAATWPNSAHHARAELSVREAMATGAVPSLDDADWHWIGAEGAAAALGEGADEVLCRLWEAADSADTVEGVLAWARASGHPEAEQVSDAVTALVAS